MEELANLEAERGNPEYLQEDRDGRNKQLFGGGKMHKKERTASKEMCDFLRMLFRNIYEARKNYDKKQSL